MTSRTKTQVSPRVGTSACQKAECYCTTTTTAMFFTSFEPKSQDWNTLRQNAITPPAQKTNLQAPNQSQRIGTPACQKTECHWATTTDIYFTSFKESHRIGTPAIQKLTFVPPPLLTFLLVSNISHGIRTPATQKTEYLCATFTADFFISFEYKSRQQQKNDSNNAGLSSLH